MGWGLFNAVSLVAQVDLDHDHGRGTLIKELELDVSESTSWQVHSDGAMPVKVTITWSDPPGNPPSSTVSVDPQTAMLVNNVDLTVETADGQQSFQPWVLEPDLDGEDETVRAQPAQGGYDDRNNVEQVVIADPEEGSPLFCVGWSMGALPPDSRDFPLWDLPAGRLGWGCGGERSPAAGPRYRSPNGAQVASLQCPILRSGQVDDA